MENDDTLWPPLTNGKGRKEKKEERKKFLWLSYPKRFPTPGLIHRMQLVLDDSVTDIKQVNHFKIFMDKIYTIFYQSNKNEIELFQISEELGQQIAKIGRVFGPRWSACSLRTALAVWRAYPALLKYFSNLTKHSGMAARLSNKYFLQ